MNEAVWYRLRHLTGRVLCLVMLCVLPVTVQAAEPLPQPQGEVPHRRSKPKVRDRSSSAAPCTV